MTPVNVTTEFDSGARITLNGEGCCIRDADGGRVVLLREEILRFVHVVAGYLIDDGCDADIGSRTVLDTGTDDDES